MFPYLAVSFTAIFWFLPHKCSQFCSPECNYCKYHSPCSSILILLGFSKDGLPSWRWPKHILKKGSKGLVLTGYYNRKLGPKYFVEPWDWDTETSRIYSTIWQSLHFWNIWRAVSTGKTNLQPWMAFNTQARWFEPVRISCYRKNFITACTCPELSIIWPGCQLCISLPNFNHSAWNNSAGWLPGLGLVGGCYC